MSREKNHLSTFLSIIAGSFFCFCCNSNSDEYRLRCATEVYNINPGTLPFVELCHGKDASLFLGESIDSVMKRCANELVEDSLSYSREYKKQCPGDMYFERRFYISRLNGDSIFIKEDFEFADSVLIAFNITQISDSQYSEVEFKQMLFEIYDCNIMKNLGYCNENCQLQFDNEYEMTFSLTQFAKNPSTMIEIAFWYSYH